MPRALERPAHRADCWLSEEPLSSPAAWLSRSCGPAEMHELPLLQPGPHWLLSVSAADVRQRRFVL